MSQRATSGKPRDPDAWYQEPSWCAERLFQDEMFPGGMVDAEFAVQYLVLSHSASHPELVGNVGNIALLQRAEQVGLLPAGVGHAAADAYRELRRVQHRARLDEVPTEVTPPALQAEQHAVLDLWHAVFGENSAVSAKA